MELTFFREQRNDSIITKVGNENGASLTRFLRSRCARFNSAPRRTRAFPFLKTGLPLSVEWITRVFIFSEWMNDEATVDVGKTCYQIRVLTLWGFLFCLFLLCLSSAFSSSTFFALLFFVLSFRICLPLSLSKYPSVFLSLCLSRSRGPCIPPSGKHRNSLNIYRNVLTALHIEPIKVPSALHGDSLGVSHCRKHGLSARATGAMQPRRKMEIC